MVVDKGEISVEREEKRFLAAAPGETVSASRRGLPLAHLCYRMGRGPHLFRCNSPVAPVGGMMVVEDTGFSGEGEAEPFCAEVLRECILRRFTGIFCRFRGAPRPVLTDVCQRLDRACRDRGWPFYVTEGYGGACQAGVVIPTAISGGSLRERLEAALARFGYGRLAVWVDRVAEDFPLPSLTGRGTPLDPKALAELRREKGGSVFFSPELCAHYFTYMAGEEGHFVLFDDTASLKKKLRTARELGIHTAFLPVGELGDSLEELLEAP